MSKVNAFKKLIKEAVREVLKEEGVLTENRTSTQPFNPSRYINEAPIQLYRHDEPQSTGDPLQDLLRQTQRESTDLSNFA
jgi:uncharacterized protein YecA (UPF0149 family)